MASIPPSGLDLWVALTKIKIKEAKVKHTHHPLKDIIKHKRTELSREI
jgi:hypothetical protein